MTVLAVHSLLTSHEEGDVIEPGPAVLRGVAWGGAGGIAGVDGGRWQPAALAAARGPYARVP